MNPFAVGGAAFGGFLSVVALVIYIVQDRASNKLRKQEEERFQAEAPTVKYETSPGGYSVRVDQDSTLTHDEESIPVDMDPLDLKPKHSSN